VLVGGLYENKISRSLVWSSIPYYQDDITWCLSKAGLAPTWLNVFIIFNSKSFFVFFSSKYIYEKFFSSGFFKNIRGWLSSLRCLFHHIFSTVLLNLRETIRKIIFGRFW
jgi:hypothetical protein